MVRLISIILSLLFVVPAFGQSRWENVNGHPNRRKFDKPEKHLNWEIGKSEGSDSVWVKMFKWSGYMDETYFNALVAVNPDTLYYVGDTLFVETPDDIRKVYEKDTGTEIEIIISKLPVDLRWTIPIRYSDNIDIAYQNKVSEYTGGELEDYLLGITHRPPPIEGSYRLRHEFKGGINVGGDRIYETGKIGHLLRPTAVDATGDTLWLDQLISGYDWDIDGTADLEWWGKAVYPVTIGPTIGDNTTGASTYTSVAHAVGFKVQYGNYTASTGDVVDAAYVYGSTSASTTLSLGVYDVGGAVNYLPVNRIGTIDDIALTGSLDWRSRSGSIGLTNGEDYTVCMGNFSDGFGTYYYDSNASNVLSRDADTNGPLNDPWGETSNRVYEMAMYLNVTAAGDGFTGSRKYLQGKKGY